MTGVSRSVPWPGDWVEQAACRGKDPDGRIFFPSDDKHVEAARTICRDCPVQDACLQYALATATRYGVWGGTSQRERQRIRGRHRDPALSATQPRVDGRFAAKGMA